MIKGLVFLALLVAAVPASAQTLAFPGAQGYGRFTSGGRGGTVYKVTHLGDKGPGSFRACIEATGPRTCIFTVGGTIESVGSTRTTPLGEAFESLSGNLTIAGETAPPPGITLKRDPIWDGDPLTIRSTGNVIIRYITFEAGRMMGPGGSDNFKSRTRDGIEFGLNTFIEDPDLPSVNGILDHVTARYGVDEPITFYFCNGTIQDSLIGWGLLNGGHEETGTHSKGILATPARATSTVCDFSMIRLMVGNGSDRMPDVENYGNHQLVNNYFYNAGNQWSEFRQRDSALTARGTGKVNVIGHVCKMGPDTEVTIPCIDHTVSGNPYTVPPLPKRLAIFIQDVICIGGCPVFDPADEAEGERVFVQHPGQPTITPIHSTANLLANIAPNVGNVLPYRDVIDRMLIEQITNNTGGNLQAPTMDAPDYARNTRHNNPHKYVPLSHAETAMTALIASCANGCNWHRADHDGDGIPNAWEREHGLNMFNSADGAAIHASGYSNLERWLHEQAARQPL